MNIELVTTLDLIEELGKRFECCVVIGIQSARYSATADDKVNPTIYKYTGGAVQAIGLCHLATMFIGAEMSMSALPREEM